MTHPDRFQLPLFRLLAAVLLAIRLVLDGCKDGPPAEAPAKPAASQVSTALIAAEAKGFAVGSAMSTRTVYVFFDPQCPHCNALWLAAKPLKSQAKFVWIPVGLMNPSSTAQGATLLAAKDPVASMDAHEASMLAKTGGISAGSDIEVQKESVAKNTALLTRLGFTSIPTIVGTHAQSGALVSQEGAMPTAALAALLGLQLPTP